MSLPNEFIEAAEKATENLLAARERHERRTQEAHQQKVAGVRKESEKALVSFVKRFGTVFPYLPILESGIEEREDLTWWGSVFLTIQVDGVEVRFFSSAHEWQWWTTDGGSNRMDTYIRIKKGELEFPERRIIFLGYDNTPVLALCRALFQARRLTRTCLREAVPTGLRESRLRNSNGADYDRNCTVWLW